MLCPNLLSCWSRNREMSTGFGSGSRITKTLIQQRMNSTGAGKRFGSYSGIRSTRQFAIATTLTHVPVPRDNCANLVRHNLVSESKSPSRLRKKGSAKGAAWLPVVFRCHLHRVGRVENLLRAGLRPVMPTAAVGHCGLGCGCTPSCKPLPRR